MMQAEPEREPAATQFPDRGIFDEGHVVLRGLDVAIRISCNTGSPLQSRATTFLPEETAMLTLHHLNDSRSQRILWLLEELGTPHEMTSYQRNAQTRLAPPELEAVHPLGKSPVITDGDVRIAESGAIVDYIIRTYGKGKMMPAPGSADFESYNEWLHYSEGSAMLPLMLTLYVSRLKEAGAPLHPRIDRKSVV